LPIFAIFGQLGGSLAPQQLCLLPKFNLPNLLVYFELQFGIFDFYPKNCLIELEIAFLVVFIYFAFYGGPSLSFDQTDG
jgi:hypothetical protein